MALNHYELTHLHGDFTLQHCVQGKHADQNRPPWPGSIVTIRVILWQFYFTTGGPDEEHSTNEPSPTGRIQPRSEGDTMRPSTVQNSSRWHHSLAEQHVSRQEGAWIQSDGQETTRRLIPSPSNLRLWTKRQGSPPGSLTLLLSTEEAPSHYSLMLFQHLCLLGQLISVLDDSPLLGPGRGPPSWNITSSVPPRWELPLQALALERRGCRKQLVSLKWTQTS